VWWEPEERGIWGRQVDQGTLLAMKDLISSGLKYVSIIGYNMGKGKNLK
jgi:hypothetical protein